MDRPIAQGTASHNNVVKVYPDRIELQSGWQGQHTDVLEHKQIVDIHVKGWVNCTLVIETNEGRIYHLEKMARPDAVQIKNAVEMQKGKVGVYGQEFGLPPADESLDKS